MSAASRTVSAMTLAGAALLVAIFGVVLAGASLIWQIVTFIASGHRVTCAMNVGYVQERGRDDSLTGSTVALTTEKWADREDLRASPVQHVFVSVVNKGRAGVWIESVGFAIGIDGPSVSVHSPRHGMPEMPTYIEAGQTKVLPIPMSLVSLIVDIPSFGATDTDCVHAFISLGTGKTLRTKQGVRVGMMKDAVARSEEADLGRS